MLTLANLLIRSLTHTPNQTPTALDAECYAKTSSVHFYHVIEVASAAAQSAWEGGTV